MLLIGMLCIFLCVLRLRTRFYMSSLQCCIFTVLGTIVGVAGAMILYFVESGFWGGISFFGSVYLIPLIMPLVGKFLGLKWGNTTDLCAPCVAIMIGCMRVNCFLSGCCGGRETCIGNFTFVWPTQVIDSISDFIILGWLLRLEFLGKTKEKLYPLFMLAYSIMRFGLEFLRDTPKDWLGLSHGQCFAIISVVVSLMWFFCISRKRQCL